MDVVDVVEKFLFWVCLFRFWFLFLFIVLKLGILNIFIDLWLEFFILNILFLLHFLHSLGFHFRVAYICRIFAQLTVEPDSFKETGV